VAVPSGLNWTPPPTLPIKNLNIELSSSVSSFSLLS
jgi:hypothetical protein